MPSVKENPAGLRLLFTWPHIIVWGFLIAAIVGVGYLDNEGRVADTHQVQQIEKVAQEARRLGRENARLVQELCRISLTTNRNLYTPLPETPEMGEDLRRYTQDVLPQFYYYQYRALTEAFRLDERCGDGLPEGTPPPPTVPPQP